MSSSSYDLTNFDAIFDDGEKLQKLSDNLKKDPSPDKQEKAKLIDDLIEKFKQYGDIAIDLEGNTSEGDSEVNTGYRKKLLELIDEMNSIGKEIDPNVKPIKPHYVGQEGDKFFMGDIYRGGKSRRHRSRRSRRSRRRNRHSSKKYKKARKSRRANRRHSRKH